MKSFFQFLTEVESKASVQARRLGLKSDGHGGWIDRRGEFVAKTEGDRLRFFDKSKKAAEEPGPERRRTPELPVNEESLLVESLHTVVGERHFFTFHTIPDEGTLGYRLCNTFTLDA